jgi:hypothetical protein
MADEEVLALADELRVPHGNVVTSELVAAVHESWRTGLGAKLADLVALNARLQRRANFPAST